MFDPYHKWLGIAKDEQPPTLYRLLGINTNEKDAEVIEEAGIRQSMHLRAYQIGAHADHCQRLLNEVAQARATLLDPAKRLAYDARLAAQSKRDAKSRPTEPEQAPRAVSAKPNHRNRNRVLIVTCIVGGAALVGLAIVLWALPGNTAKTPKKDDPPAKKTTGTGVAKKKLPPALAAKPIARWVFDGGTRDAIRDNIGALHAEIEGNPQFVEGKLRLGPTDGLATVELPLDVSERTLEAWISLPVSNQKSGVVMKIERAMPLDGIISWDGIIFSDSTAGRWTPGSSFRQRSQESDQLPETAGPSEVLQLATVYERDNSISLYRNGKLHVGPFTPTGPHSSLQTYLKGTARIRFGGGIVCDLVEARLYNRALTVQEIAASFREMNRKL